MHLFGKDVPSLTNTNRQFESCFPSFALRIEDSGSFLASHRYEKLRSIVSSQPNDMHGSWLKCDCVDDLLALFASRDARSGLCSPSRGPYGLSLWSLRVTGTNLLLTQRMDSKTTQAEMGYNRKDGVALASRELEQQENFNVSAHCDCDARTCLGTEHCDDVDAE